MGRKKATPELQRLKTVDGSPELTKLQTQKTVVDGVIGRKGRVSKAESKPAAVTRVRTRTTAARLSLAEAVSKMDDNLSSSAEDTKQKEAVIIELSAKMVYSKKQQSKLAKPSIVTDVPAPRWKPNGKCQPKEDTVDVDLGEVNENLEADKNDHSQVISPKQFYSRSSKRCSSVGQATSKPYSGIPVRQTKPAGRTGRGVGRPSIKRALQMTTEQVVSQFTQGKEDKNGTSSIPVGDVLKAVVEIEADSTKGSGLSKPTGNGRTRRSGSMAATATMETEASKSATKGTKSLPNTRTRSGGKALGPYKKTRGSTLTIAEVVAEVATDGSSKEKSAVSKKSAIPKPGDSDVGSSFGSLGISSELLQNAESTAAGTLLLGRKPRMAAGAVSEELKRSWRTGSKISPIGADSGKKVKKTKGQQKKVSGSLEGEWDRSLLLVTDDLDESKNVYDFEEFQVGLKTSGSSSSSATSSRDSNGKTSKSSVKVSSIRKTAAIKVFNNNNNKKKVGRKDTVAQTKAVKKTSAPRKTSAPKKPAAARKTTAGTAGKTAAVSVKPVSAPPVSALPVSTPGTSTVSATLQSSGVTAWAYTTPVDQVMTEPISFTEIEKIKATKHIENRVVVKVNPGLNRQGSALPASSAWPQLPMPTTKQFTKLKRSPMEGPTAVDALPENIPRSTMLKFAPKQCLQSQISNSASVEAAKPKTSKQATKRRQETNDPNLEPKVANKQTTVDTNQHINLFTYPNALPPKIKTNKPKNGKSKENKITPVKGPMDFMYAGSVERYLKPIQKPLPPQDTMLSPPSVMLPKFLRAETSTPHTQPNVKSFGGESMCISPVKEFQSPASMRTYGHISRRNSSVLFSPAHNMEDALFSDDSDNVPQKKKAGKIKTKKKETVQNGNIYDEWANRMSDEFDEIEHFELSIEA